MISGTLFLTGAQKSAGMTSRETSEDVVSDPTELRKMARKYLQSQDNGAHLLPCQKRLGAMPRSSALQKGLRKSEGGIGDGSETIPTAKNACNSADLESSDRSAKNAAKTQGVLEKGGTQRARARVSRNHCVFWPLLATDESEPLFPVSAEDHSWYPTPRLILLTASYWWLEGAVRSGDTDSPVTLSLSPDLEAQLWRRYQLATELVGERGGRVAVRVLLRALQLWPRFAYQDGLRVAMERLVTDDRLRDCAAAILRSEEDYFESQRWIAEHWSRAVWSFVGACASGEIIVKGCGEFDG
jgi:hypothetical protein